MENKKIFSGENIFNFIISEVIIMENKDKSKKVKKKVKFKGKKEIIVSDVNGSYTGVPTDPMDLHPVQDADDL